MRSALVQRFRTAAALPDDHKSWATAVVEIRAGQLWKDGEYRPFPAIFHEVLIPDESMKTQSWDQQDGGLKIRLVVLNGFVKIQIGKWDEQAGHHEIGQTSGT